MLMLLMDPWIRPGMCTLHFLRQFGAAMRDKRAQGHPELSIGCQTLYQETQYRSSLKVLQAKLNNSCEIECILLILLIADSADWLIFEIGETALCAIQTIINNLDENYKIIVTVYYQYLIIVIRIIS